MLAPRKAATAGGRSRLLRGSVRCGGASGGLPAVMPVRAALPPSMRGRAALVAGFPRRPLTPAARREGARAGFDRRQLLFSRGAAC